MFDNYYRSKTKKMPAWAPPLVAVGVAIHVALFVGMWVKTTWDIKKLEVPDNEIELALAPPPPPVSARLPVPRSRRTSRSRSARSRSRTSSSR